MKFADMFLYGVRKSLIFPRNGFGILGVHVKKGVTATLLYDQMYVILNFSNTHFVR